MPIQDNELHGSIGARSSVGDASESTAAVSMHGSINMISGQVTYIHQGLLNVGIRVRIGKRTDLLQTVDPNSAKGDPVRDARVWMRAQVTEVGEAPYSILTLNPS